MEFPFDLPSPVVSTEVMGPHMTKYHLANGQVIHHFTSTADENIHNRPFAFTSTILFGGYIERRHTFDLLTGRSAHMDIEHPVGETFRVEATDMHEIIMLPKGECFTLIVPENKTQEPSFYRIEASGIFKRFWYEKDWTELTQKK